jgi:hypothetical protein
MDISEAAAPRSDQINADDLYGGPCVVTITEVRKGSVEQPVEIVTAEFGAGRPYKPGKSMIRVLIAAWGKEASAYKGRRLMIYRDPDITFGKDRVGGIRISAMSHIDQRLTLALTVTRGRRAPFTVEPLPDAPPPITLEAADHFEGSIAKADTLEELDTIAADLKACDLGEHRQRLLSAYSDRRKAMEAAK